MFFHSGAVIGSGPWLDVVLLQPTNSQAFYYGLKREYTGVGTPATLAAVDGGAGGSLTPGVTYFYKVTALDGNGGVANIPFVGESAASNETSFLQPGASHKVTLTWGSVPSAAGFAIYRSTSSGFEVLMTTVVWVQGAAQVLTFTDDGSFTPALFPPPSNDNSSQVFFYALPALGGAYSVGGNLLRAFPATSIPFMTAVGSYDSGGQSTGQGSTAGAPPNIYGGVVNAIGPLPQIIPFVGKAMMALGNGYAPQIFTPPATTAPLTNTFTAVYPDWVTNTTYNTGDKIRPNSINAGGFVFTASQAGTSAVANPTFPQTQGQTVTDGKIIWLNTGATAASPVPRGAAHAIVYAGSMWLANTSPTTTADQLDGPTCLKMSDVNTMTSWNPVNTAFIGRDDGTQITGLAVFTVAAEGIAPLGSLVVFKDFQTYQVIGVFGASDFAIEAAQTDMGCVAPRTIQFLPGFGICRLAHLGVAVFDGVRDRLISEEIRPYLFGGEQDIQGVDWSLAYFSKSCQDTTPPCYILAVPLLLQPLPGVLFTTQAGASTFLNTMYWGMVTKFTSFNGVVQETQVSIVQAFGRLDSGTQIRVVVPFDSNAIKYRVYIGNIPNTPNRFVEFSDLSGGQVLTGLPGGFGTPSSGLGGLTRMFCYDLVLKCWTIVDLPWPISALKQVRASGVIPLSITGGFSDETIRRIHANDPDWDGTAINWSAQTAEVFGKTTDQRMFYRRLVVRGEYVGTAPTISCTVSVSQKAQTTTNMRLISQGVNNGVTQFAAYQDIYVNGLNAHAAIASSGQIEIYGFDWEITPMKEGVPVVI